MRHKRLKLSAVLLLGLGRYSNATEIKTVELKPVNNYIL